MKITEATCVCDDVYKKKKKKKEDGQIMSLGDSRIKRVRDRILSMLTVRVVVLQYNQLQRLPRIVSIY